MKLEVQPLAIPDVKLIRTQNRFADPRGYFAETYARRDFAAAGIATDFVQDNEVLSVAAGTVRGLHFQSPPFAQAKLVRTVRGRILDVAVDLRRSSPSYRRHVAVELDDRGGEQLLVPAGFAHGYCTLQADTLVSYKVDKVYAPDYDHGIDWSDPSLGIAWPVDRASAVVSDRDRALPRLDDGKIYFA
jgi:dTDP-4-dehydrorhamnose 3,5-epimerase